MLFLYSFICIEGIVNIKLQSFVIIELSHKLALLLT